MAFARGGLPGKRLLQIAMNFSPPKMDETPLYFGHLFFFNQRQITLKENPPWRKDFVSKIILVT